MKRIYMVGLGIFLLATGACYKSSELKIKKWGPQSTPAGQLFNVQPDGESALWFELSGEANLDETEAWFGDHKIDQLMLVSQQGGSMIIPTEFLKKSGKFPVYLIHIPTGKRVDIGTFEVLSSESPAPVLKITKWGPQKTSVGVPFNKQPNGISALWFNVSGVMDVNTMKVWFGDHELDTLTGLVKSSTTTNCSVLVPTELLEKPAEIPVNLIHTPSKTKFPIGSFKITEKSTK